MQSRLATRMVRLAILIVPAVLGLSPAAAAAAAPPAAPSGYIVGGSEAPAGSWDFAAFVSIHDGKSVGSCTASVLAPNVVLTAGHCVVSEKTGKQLPASAFKVATGTLDLANSAARQVSAVTSVLLGPGFSIRALRPDEALLVLATPTTAPTIAIASVSDTALFTPGSQVVLAGWGIETGTGKQAPSKLQTTNTQLQSDTACGETAANALLHYLPGWMLCTAGGGTACKGDSGGPIIAPSSPTPASLADWRLIGTTSWGDPTCAFLSVGASVLPLSAWITQQIAIAAGNPAVPAAGPVGRVATPLGTQAPRPAQRVATKLELRLLGHDGGAFRVELLAEPKVPIDKIHVRLEYATGHGFKTFAAVTLVSGRPYVRQFSGDKGHYDIRAVAAAGRDWTGATSKRAIFTLR